MKKDLKEKWVKALRSGEYKQGRKALRSICNNYCCLGVLCDITDNSLWNDDEHKDIYFYDKCGTYSAKPITDNLERSWVAELVKLNDELKNNFSQIADFIEKEIPTDD